MKTNIKQKYLDVINAQKELIAILNLILQDRKKAPDYTTKAVVAINKIKKAEDELNTF